MFEDIGVFCAIAKNQSFAKAARELGLSTPVVTRRLARLEQTLGARLLNRTTREVSLTEAGGVFYEEVYDILQALEASKDCVKSLSGDVVGTLKIALPIIFSQIHVAPALNSFLTKYPKLQIQIVSGTDQLHLLNQGFDLVIHCGELPSSSFHYKKLSTMKKIICASPDYLKKNGIPKSIDDLQSHNCLNIYSDTCKIWQVFENGKIREILTSGNVHVNSGIDIKLLALGGVGIAYLPRYLIDEELKTNKLISVFDQKKAVDHNIYAVYPTTKYLSKKTKLFLNFVSELLEKVSGE